MPFRDDITEPLAPQLPPQAPGPDERQPTRDQIAKAKEAEYATVPPVTMTREAAINYGARVMDPLTSVRLADGTSPSATVYVGERLVLRASAPEGTADAFSTLDAVAKDLGVTLHRVSTYPRPETDLVTSGPAADIIAKHWVDGVQIVPDADKAAYPVDSWPILRALQDRTQTAASDLALDHLMTTAQTKGCLLYTSPSPRD